MINILLKTRNNHQGFTLAELLISTVISLLLLMTISIIFTSNQKIWRKGNNEAELLQNARIITDLMAREVRQAKEIITVLPADDSNPGLIAHELQFEDGHTESHIQYIRYYLDETGLRRQVIVYYFSIDENTYVYWNDSDAFGPPAQKELENRLIGEYFSEINFYGSGQINIDLTLLKNGDAIEMNSQIYPRNI